MCFLQQLADYPHACFSFGGVEARNHPLSGMVRRLATSLCTNGSVFQFMIRILRAISIYIYIYTIIYCIGSMYAIYGYIW